MKGVGIYKIFLIFYGVFSLSITPLQGQDSYFAVIKELPPNRWREEVDAIDKAVEVLTDLRNKELARAARAQDQGDRLQFQFPNLIDARRAWEEADKSRAIAARYQEEIKRLDARKRELLRKYDGQMQSPSQIHIPPS